MAHPLVVVPDLLQEVLESGPRVPVVFGAYLMIERGPVRFHINAGFLDFLTAAFCSALVQAQLPFNEFVELRCEFLCGKSVER